MLLTEKAHKCNAGQQGPRRRDFSLPCTSKGSQKGPVGDDFGMGDAAACKTCLNGPAFGPPMKSTLIPLFMLSAALAAPNKARAELQVGDKAPEVTGITETGQKLSFAEVYSKQAYTLVYFYPKADTSGCTAQGCSLRDAYEVLTKKGVVVIGVSLDQADAQKAFKEKNHFPFTLIADPDKTVVNAFGVSLMSTPIGQLAHREAYLIKDGKIVWADYHAKTDKQAEDVLAVIAGQPKG